MERFFHHLHERRESLKREELSKRNQWKEDESRVRNSSCDFAVKYLGCAEVNESKGMQTIENAVKILKFGDQGQASQFSFLRNRSKPSENLYHFGTLHVSGSEIRFVEDSTEDVLVDSPIEKISFCGPMENGKIFAYICREESHWKWICHAFKITEDHADRINNAVGCAFRFCLEKRHKERMENESRISDAQSSQIRTNATTTTSGTKPFVSSSNEQHLVDHFDLAWESKVPRTGQS